PRTIPDRDEARRTPRPRGARRWRAKSTRTRVAPAVYGVSAEQPQRRWGRRPELSTAHPVIPNGEPLRWSTQRDPGRLPGVAQILVCFLIAAALSTLPAGSASIAARPAHPFPVDLLARAGPDDAGQPPGRRFGWPLSGSPAVVRGFHPPALRYGPGHRGVDLAAAAGEPVLAAGAGTVVFAGVVAGRGVVSLSHPGGLRTTYE